MFNVGTIYLQHEETITEFPEKLYVKNNYVTNYVQHLTNLQHGKDIRSKKRAKDKCQRDKKGYDDYSWLDLVVSGKLESLKVVELDKYLDRNKLKKHGKKADNINAITVKSLRRPFRKPDLIVIIQMRVMKMLLALGRQ